MSDTIDNVLEQESPVIENVTEADLDQIFGKAEVAVAMLHDAATDD